MPVTAPIADTSRAAPHLDAVLRRRIARLGMWVFLASEVLFFGGLFFAYAHGRLQWPEGFAAAGRHTDVVLGTVNTAVLLTSSFLVALAVEAAAHGRRTWVPWLLWGTAALGLAFLAVKGVEYRAEFREYLFPGPAFWQDQGGLPPPGAEVFFMLYFTATGLHAVHMAVGIGAVALFAWHAREPGSDWLRSSRMETVALYWHFVDLVWIFLYPLLYLMGRHA
jgi:cytochrome c oxidase subunit III